MSQGNQDFSPEYTFIYRLGSITFIEKQILNWTKLKNIQYKGDKISQLVHVSHTNLNHSPVVLNLIYFSNTTTDSYVLVYWFCLSWNRGNVLLLVWLQNISVLFIFLFFFKITLWEATRPLKAPFLLWIKITALYKKHAATPSSVVSCKPSNKFLFPLKIINICVCMRDLGNTDLHFFFLHRDKHFSHKKVAAPCNRTIFLYEFCGKWNFSNGKI